MARRAGWSCHVTDLRRTSRTATGEVKGPPESAAFDKDGKPTQAALGCARKNGLRYSGGACARRLVQERDGGRYVVAVVRRPGARRSRRCCRRCCRRLLREAQVR